MYDEAFRVLLVLSCCYPCLAGSDVPTWTIVMLAFLSCLIVVLFVALLCTLKGIRKLSEHFAQQVSARPSVAPLRPEYTALVDPYAQPQVNERRPGAKPEDVPVELLASREAAAGDDANLVDPTEQEAVDAMRAAVPAGAAESYTIFGRHEVMDAEFFLRFLRARNFDLAKSQELMLHYLQWRQTTYPSGPPINELRDRMWRGVVYIDFLDKAGRAVVVLRVKLHDKNWPSEETKHVAVLSLDAALHHAPPHVHQFSVLVDLDGFGLVNADLTALKNCLAILDQCYPERLGNLWFIHANFMFMNLWRVVRGFINPNTANKIHFFGADYKEQLLASIDSAVLPRAYGGLAPDPEIKFVGRYAPPGL